MKYEVFLSNRGNPDRDQNPFQPLYGTGSDEWVSCDSIEHAQQLAEEYRDDNGLGGGNWGDANVRDVETAEIVGHISYNGRFWPADGSEHVEAPVARM
jgi:hypothetical protein